MKKILICGLVLMMVACNNTIKKDETIEETATPSTGCDIGKDECNDPALEIVNYEEKISSDTFIEISMKDSVEAIENKESLVILYGFKTCPWCQDVVDYVKEAADKVDVKVNYVNARIGGDTKEFDIRVDSNPDYVALQTIFKDIMMDETNKIYVPLLVVIKNGEIVDHHYATVDGHEASEREMNEDEIKILQKKYAEMFEKFLN